MRRKRSLTISCFPLFLVVSCSSTAPRIEPPRIDAQRAAASAIERFDEDRNGSLSDQELTAIAGVLFALKDYDKDLNGEVSSSEIVERIRVWQASPIGIRTVRCRVLMNNKPIAGATVIWKPEEFLGDDLHPASGITDANGFADVGLDAGVLPAGGQRVVGVPCGLYKIEITHPTLSIPSRFNSKSTLGREVAPDNAAEHMVFALDE